MRGKPAHGLKVAGNRFHECSEEEPAAAPATSNDPKRPPGRFSFLALGARWDRCCRFVIDMRMPTAEHRPPERCSRH